jgi:hypothetical protein|tara:strand:- start:1054 stop:1266 length:213 start_codon:yes stop_codon:yes gene_type:complete
MKIILTLFMCSISAGECLPPYKWPENFKDSYDCMHFGYKESQRKMEEIGRVEVNKHGIYIRFVCTPITET